MILKNSLERRVQNTQSEKEKRTRRSEWVKNGTNRAWIKMSDDATVCNINNVLKLKYDANMFAGVYLTYSYAYVLDEEYVCAGAGWLSKNSMCKFASIASSPFSIESLLVAGSVLQLHADGFFLDAKTLWFILPWAQLIAIVDFDSWGLFLAHTLSDQ